MHRIIRDRIHSALILLLISCSAAITGLGATVHIFTLQQTNTVAEEIPLLASRTDYQQFNGTSFLFDAEIIETVNASSVVKTPILSKGHAAIADGIIPLSSHYPDGQDYAYIFDRGCFYAVITGTCISTRKSHNAHSSEEWSSQILVEQVHEASTYYDIPDVIEVYGSTHAEIPADPLVVGETYLLSGIYYDYPMTIDPIASFATGVYDPVYMQDTTTPPSLRLGNWADLQTNTKTVTSPNDEEWLKTATMLAHSNNSRLLLYCIDTLDRVKYFTDGLAYITEGRSFTQAELDDGAKVCLMHVELASANGLNVGDSISLDVYEAGFSRTYYTTPGMMCESLTFTDVRNTRHEDLTLEIIGFYYAPMWKMSAQAISPNAIFAPYSITTIVPDVYDATPICLQDIILHTGNVEVFQQELIASGLPKELYAVEEKNYDSIKEVLDYMSSDSLGILAISASVGMVMLSVVLALYARGWQKENAILAMLGTTKARIGGRMFGSLAVLTLLGSAAAFGGMCAAKSYIEEALNSIYIGKSADFSAIRVGAFSEEGMTIGVEVIAAALTLTAAVFLLIAAIQSIISARKKVRECLFD